MRKKILLLLSLIFILSSISWADDFKVECVTFINKGTGHIRCAAEIENISSQIYNFRITCCFVGSFSRIYSTDSKKGELKPNEKARIIFFSRIPITQRAGSPQDTMLDEKEQQEFINFQKNFYLSSPSFTKVTTIVDNALVNLSSTFILEYEGKTEKH